VVIPMPSNVDAIRGPMPLQAVTGDANGEPAMVLLPVKMSAVVPQAATVPYGYTVSRFLATTNMSMNLNFTTASSMPSHRVTPRAR